MQRLESDKGVKVSFLESKKDADYAPNLAKVTDDAPDIVWGIGFLMKDALAAAAESNPDQRYALVDDVFEDGQYPERHRRAVPGGAVLLPGRAISPPTRPRRTMSASCSAWRAPSWTASNTAMRPACATAPRSSARRSSMTSRWPRASATPPRARPWQQKMYTDGADVIFHAAGQTGSGAIEAAKEMNKMVIGVDLDQNFLAPDNVITSALKNVGNAVYDITGRIMDGEELGGTNVTMGLAEGGVGIAPSSDKHLSAELLAQVDELQQKIIDGEIVVPYTQEDFDAFVANL